MNVKYFFQTIRLASVTTAFTACLLTALVGCKSEPAKPSADSADVSAPAKPLRVLGKIAPFSLTDRGETTIGSETLEGKVWVGTFIFTRCGLTCPKQTESMLHVQRKLAAQEKLGRVRLVSFTVDPEYDTPEVLHEYAEKYTASPMNWHFLTGDRETIWDLSTNSFKLEVVSGRDEEGLISHSPMLILVDHKMQIRGYYDGTKSEPVEQLRRDIDKVLAEQDSEVTDVAFPPDVRDPPWIAERAANQKVAVEKSGVRSDFRFVDRREASKIDFHDVVVNDVKENFRSSHYDHGSGIAAADVDGDGHLDVYFVSQFGESQLWRNLGDGTFQNFTEQSGTGIDQNVQVGASFADIDNDGDADLYVTSVQAPNKLFINDGKGQFTEKAAEAGLDHVGHSSGSVFFDYDRDGYLDLLLTTVGRYTSDRKQDGYYLAYPSAFTGHLSGNRDEANILFRNLGNGKFKYVNEEVGFVDKSWSGDATPIDANDDGWPDIYLLSMQGHDEYFENQQGKRFVRKSRDLFPATPWGTMGVKVFDYNRDGTLDLFVTDMHTDMVEELEPHEEKNKMRRNLPIKMLATDGNHVLGNALYRKNGKDEFTEVSDSVNSENYWPWGISVADLNADGFEDVFVAASMNYPFRYGINSVLLNNTGKQFVDSEFALGVEPRDETSQYWMQLDCSNANDTHPACQDCVGTIRVHAAKGTRSSVVFDIEDDGDLDIITNDFGGVPMVLVSDLSNQASEAEQAKLNFLKIALVGSKSNRDGLGAIVKVVTDDGEQVLVNDGKSGYMSQSRLPLYVGLGNQDNAKRIEVVWPSGKTQVVDGPIESRKRIEINESQAD